MLICIYGTCPFGFISHSHPMCVCVLVTTHNASPVHSLTDNDTVGVAWAVQCIIQLSHSLALNVKVPLDINVKGYDP